MNTLGYLRCLQTHHHQSKHAHKHLPISTTHVMTFMFLQLVVLMSVPSATVFARRGFSYLMNGQPELALRDAMQAQVCMPEWPTAFYLQALALSKLGMETDAQDMLNDGAAFEAKKQNSWRG